MALYKDTDTTPDDLREAVTTLEDAERIARRVMGGAHPLTSAIENELREARAALRARETPRQTIDELKREIEKLKKENEQLRQA